MEIFYLLWSVQYRICNKTKCDKCTENVLELKNIYRRGDSVYLHYFSSLVKLRQTQASSVLDKQIC